MKTISHHAALVYTMVIVSASDGTVHDRELQAIDDLARHLPAFKGFDADRLPALVQDCSSILQEEEGFAAALGLIKGALSEPLRETAYWLALEIALIDHRVALEEIRVIEAIRHALGLDKLVAAALERGARARYQVS